MIHLIYFHGFQSHAGSVKGRLLQQYCGQYCPNIVVYLPDLNCSPGTVVDKITRYIKQYPQAQFFCVGSSLGGFYANYIACLYGLKAVLINPVVNPSRVFTQRIGAENLPYQVTATWVLQQEDLKDLDRMFATVNLAASQRLVLLQQDDEVLDYQQAERYYMQSLVQCMVVTMRGGNHVMDNFSEKIPMILMFLLRYFTARNI